MQTSSIINKEKLLSERKKCIGYNVALNYSKDPLLIMRGEGQYLFDENNKRYLDCINNVSHVGHAHPRVVAGISQQLMQLNTNSRFLHPSIVQASQKVISTLPSPLQVVFWCNSGSEANDLALRLARTHTGKRGVITVGGAYHGHLTSIIDISPYKYASTGGKGKRGWVKEVPAPDIFSGPHRMSQQEEIVLLQAKKKNEKEQESNSSSSSTSNMDIESSLSLQYAQYVFAAMREFAHDEKVEDRILLKQKQAAAAAIAAATMTKNGASSTITTTTTITRRPMSSTLSSDDGEAEAGVETDANTTTSGWGVEDEEEDGAETVGSTSPTPSSSSSAASMTASSSSAAISSLDASGDNTTTSTPPSKQSGNNTKASPSVSASRGKRRDESISIGNLSELVGNTTSAATSSALLSALSKMGNSIHNSSTTATTKEAREEAEEKEEEEERLHLASNIGDDRLQAGCACFIMESLLSCGGQIMPPQNYLRSVYAEAKKHNIVTIADEVQVGFGRLGSNMWGFQAQGEDIVPDIVTMGKPLGNGFPVSCVVTTPEIAASFANTGMEYFNTFGGNPAAAAAVLATFQVFEEEKLQENAVRVGQVLLKGFHELAKEFDGTSSNSKVRIGSVRGDGLMLGLEFVKDIKTREPDGETAIAVKYACLQEYNILLSTDGMFDEVMKLKPPMCFNEDNAREVLAALGAILRKM